MLFFFSSRRRHTRYWRDWSSDVCSSDLFAPSSSSRDGLIGGEIMKAVVNGNVVAESEDVIAAAGYDYFPPAAVRAEWLEKEIGRASCRESVDIGGVRDCIKNKEA